MLAALVIRRTAASIELRNRVVIEVHTCSFRSTRGYTFAAVIADEVAFWRSDDSASPDLEVLAALRPGLATLPGSQLVGISSPYARRGAAWQAFRNHHGRDHDPVLVWKADTATMNPTVSAHVIAAAYEAYPVAASSEYGGEFRTDLEAFVSREALVQGIRSKGQKTNFRSRPAPRGPRGRRCPPSRRWSLPHRRRRRPTRNWERGGT
jgi:hypothetical protein